MPDLICDFCSSPHVAWSYRARSFAVEASPMSGSAGWWAACQACHDLIEANDHHGLARRSLDSFRAMVGAEVDTQDTYLFLRRIHMQFRENRVGSAIPYHAPAEQGAQP